MEETSLGLTIESLIRQCRRLVSLCSEFECHRYLQHRPFATDPVGCHQTSCFILADSPIEATESAISPSKLFKSSYSLRETAYWLTEYQSERAYGGVWSTGISLSRHAKAPDSMLAMQMVVVDSATVCAPRQFGWSDTDSALAILMSWLRLSISNTAHSPHLPSHVIPESAGPGGAIPKPGRVRQFAETIIGGRCRRSGSYQEPDSATIDTIMDWLFSLEGSRVRVGGF